MSSQFQPDDLSAILEGISDAVVRVDRRCNYTAINRAAAEIFRGLGQNPHEMIGKSIWEVFPEVKGTVVEKELTRVLECHVPVNYELYYPPAKKWYRTDGYPSHNGMLLIFREIPHPSRY